MRPLWVLFIDGKPKVVDLPKRKKDRDAFVAYLREQNPTLEYELKPYVPLAAVGAFNG
jgi:hypothetical protein